MPNPTTPVLKDRAPTCISSSAFYIIHIYIGTPEQALGWDVLYMYVPKKPY